MRSAGRIVLALGAIVLAIFMGAGMANERGDALGIITMFGWAAIAMAVIFEREQLVAHRWLDRGVVSVFVFFCGVAMFTNLPLAVCAAIAIFLAAVLWVRDSHRGDGAARAA